MKSPPRCNGKTTYGSWDEAQLVLTDCKIRAAFHGSRKRRERRSYWCDIHQGWHLTSEPQRRPA